VRIQEGNERKAAFITPLRLYKPTIMQFRLCNTPSTFQRIVDDVLAKEIRSGCVEVYMDDILVHTGDVNSN
jgi:hypothetical protein